MILKLILIKPNFFSELDLKGGYHQIEIGEETFFDKNNIKVKLWVYAVEVKCFNKLTCCITTLK
jgi:hypothetical protein